jgi:hypothetical protein
MNLRRLNLIDYILVLVVFSALIFLFNLFGVVYSDSESFKKIGPVVGALFVGYFWMKLAYGKPKVK